MMKATSGADTPLLPSADISNGDVGHGIMIIQAHTPWIAMCRTEIKVNSRHGKFSHIAMKE